MPRYFFHTADGSRARDGDGIELPNVIEARKEAVRFAGAVLNDNPDLLWDGRDFRVEVTDAENDLMITIVVVAIWPNGLVG